VPGNKDEGVENFPPAFHPLLPRSKPPACDIQVRTGHKLLPGTFLQGFESHFPTKDVVKQQVFDRLIALRTKGVGAVVRSGCFLSVCSCVGGWRGPRPTGPILVVEEAPFILYLASMRSILLFQGQLPTIGGEGRGQWNEMGRTAACLHLLSVTLLLSRPALLDPYTARRYSTSSPYELLLIFGSYCAAPTTQTE
jgi:hypothetical protein